jgi:putative flavoprotein involved in K+ transport
VTVAIVPRPSGTFTRPHSWIRIPGVVDDGRLIDRRGVTPVPGLYFLGLSWQHTRGSALVGFVGQDAAYLADRIAEHQHAVEPASAATSQHRST